MTDHERQIIQAGLRDFERGVGWFYEQVVEKREKFDTPKAVKELFKSIDKKIDERLMASPSDIVEDILGWEKGPDTEKRNKYIGITSMLAITQGTSHSDVHAMFLDASKKFLLEDYEHPLDAFMSKKEQRTANKRRKIEKKHGKKPTATIKTDSEKKEASRIRRLGRKAKEEGVTLEEYLNKNGYGPDGLKAKAS